MNVSAERSRSVWMDTPVGEAPALDKAETADVVVIGSGIVGLSTAYELTAKDRSVVVLDRGPLGGGMTARTTAHLAFTLDDFYYEFIRLRGRDEAQLHRESQAAAIDRMEAIAREGNGCDFQRLDAYLFLAPDGDPKILEHELDACREIGIAADWVERAPLKGADTGRCLRFPHQARVHPLKYLAELARAVHERNGRLYANTCVTGIEETDDGVEVKTGLGHTVKAQAAVVATNSPINDRVAIHTKQAPYRTYVIAGPVPRNGVTDALYWDTGDPYHYVRLQPAGNDSTLLIVGGEDHRTGEADDADKRFEALETWARQHFPALRTVSHRWSGQVLEPVDYAAFIGRNHGNKNIYVATGDSGQGITNGALAGILISDLIVNGESPWAEVYDPARKSARATGEFLREQVPVMENLAEYVTGGEVDSLDALAPGQGAVVRQGLKKIAAYRDAQGALHLHSAACTHLGCIVHWNSLEQCWDCPCHGSQFGIDGVALNGPAVGPLADAQG